MHNAGQKGVTTQEVLVFDSCTSIAEIGLMSKGTSALKHYLYHRGIQLVVPEVVAEECERHLTDRAMDRKKRIEKSLEWLGRFCGRVNGWSAPSDEAIAARAKALATVDHLRAVVLSETDTLRRRAELRAQAERPPSHRRPSLADCKIWEQCLELLAEHDVVFVTSDGDFCGHRQKDKLHPQLQAEADEVGKGRSLTFHPNMESLLSELRSQIPPIPKVDVFAFIYDAISADMQELQSNSGCQPKVDGKVTQTLLTTDQAEVIEVRLEVEDTWESADGTEVADFRLSGSCHYRLTDKQLSDLTLSRVALLITQPDGSVRAVKGSYTNIGPLHLYLGGAPPIEPEQVTLE